MPIPTPWMAYYPDRFTKQTDQLRPIEHSAYYRLFESYAQTGHLLNDPYMLRNIVKLDSELTVIQGVTGTKPDYGTWVEFTDSIVNSLLAQFFSLESDGTYHHAGWDKEVAKARASYDGRVKGAIAANAKRDAERSAEQPAEQHTTNNEQRTTLEPIIDISTADSEQLTADNPQLATDKVSEQSTANSRQLITHNSQQTSVSFAVTGRSGVSGRTLWEQTARQRTQERPVRGTPAKGDLTSATSHRWLTTEENPFTPEQQAEIDRHPPGSPERLAAIKKFRVAA